MTVVDKSAQLTRKDRGRHADRFFWALCVSAGFAVLVILALILITMVKQAYPAFSADFFTSSSWIPNDPDGDGPGKPVYGTLAFLYGTLIVSAIAVIVAVPVSIGIALFLTELAPRRIRSAIVTLIDLLAAVPSVVFGLWGILVVAPAVVPVYQWLHDVLGGIPVLGSLFGEPRSSGRTFMTAGLILAIMIVPIITSIAREVFATVPDSDKHAAWALGATRWEMIKGAVLPHSFGGVVGAVILGLGRAMGETIAVALVIGSSVQITANLFESGYALPAIIVDQWGESTGEFTAALIGMGVVLFVITVLVNLVARFVVRRAEIRMRGASA
ncbi:phosphate ABC transporter permease subunit PstC [Catellatospora citrea]|uniref:Phosphate transport system permease protein n=1 Tax=Catellatospora citrea TaxID=53366 RepID=A0A8J3P4N5_9ACTN|nr:phosphate ABC transporter permease subunit PstC [Catellatospora citrea]RKE08524.1 phosphate ABC transporter membrane protein 1 (PhoT family) [Catellatospora citrea]GIG01391.1 phosphate transport system permease protein [Catellatospora citrea]